MELPLEPSETELDWDAEFRELESGWLADNEPPTDRETEEENQAMLRRQYDFRLAAEYVAKAWATLPEVQRVVLLGSVARPLRKQVPRFYKFRRARRKIWHECKDVDLAVWLTRLDDLKALKRLRKKALDRLLAAHHVGVAHHQVDVFILEPKTDRLLGHLCGFKTCPKPGKAACLVPRCGASPFLQQFPDFHLRADALAPGKTVVLYDRQAGIHVEPAMPEE